MNKKIIIIGASGHGKVVADIAKLCGYNEIIFLDDSSDVDNCAGYPVKGAISDAHLYPDYDFFVAIGNAHVRQRILNSLIESEYRIATLIHPASVVASSSTIGEGSVVMACAVINPCSVIGRGCIINTCSSVDHDCVIDDYVHISVGARVCGTVKVGSSAWIGAGAVLINNINITENSTVGAGAVVIRSLDEQGTYVGVPAEKID